ncbi:hypothetical protein OSSY52_18320 [Tepiditoga spiralis]|uniref:Uncharacterized protein n=1 Tax=Tepiditoga spiralis TaxID=2108365 RepID=A0A7G1G5K5_9BACT|nr:hypothetical protein [Tepiditoga spiralis]BBE31691.1 hypothetical protein OSSY52_18320 [Tepiditoga spiralis]
MFLIIMISISNFSNLNDFLNNFDEEIIINSENKEMNILGLYLKYWKTGYEDYKTTANIMRSELYKNFSADESVLLNILSETIPFDYFKPQKDLEEALNIYNNSIILNSMYIYFAYTDWEKSRNLIKLKKINGAISKIEQLKGKTPFTSYYHSLILWNSKIYQNKNEAYNELKAMYINHKDNQKILELLIKFCYSLNKLDEIISYSELYKNFSKKDNKILLLIAKTYQKNKNYKKSRDLIQNIINNTNKNNVLASSYEILGDMASTTSQKINYYRLSLKNDPKNPTVLEKLGRTYYTGNEKNLNLARIYLSKSLTFDPNQEKTYKMLISIQKKYRIYAFFSYVLPLFLISVLLIFILIHKKNEKEIIVEKIGEKINVKNEIMRSEKNEE